MDIERLANTLTRILDPSSDEWRTAHEKASKVSPDFYETMFDYYLAESVEQVLSAAPEFPQGIGYLIEQPDGATGFHAHEAAVAMLLLARETNNVAGAVDWLRRALCTERASGTSIMALWGVTVAEPVQLTSTISLVPLDAIPDSVQKEWLLRPRNFADVLHFIPFALTRAPSVALTIRAEMAPVLTRQEENRQTKPLYHRNLLTQARLALSAVGPSAPMHASSWFQFDDPDLQRAAIHGGVVGTHHEIVPWGHDPDVALDPSAAKAVVTGFFELNEITRDRVSIALERLNQAVRRVSQPDNCLELGIALEALLTDGPGENTYKVGLRAGLLTPGDIDARLAARSTVGALYQLRSSVAHDGKIPSDVRVYGRGRVPSNEVIRASLSIVADVIREVIARRSVPEWYRVELGAQGK